MRTKLLITLLLIPGLLFAKSEKKLGSKLTVKQADKLEQPAGTIDRVSKRTLTSLTFEKDSIGSGLFRTVISPGSPLCWDSAGKLVKIDLSERAAKTKDFQKAVKIAGSFIEYDSLGNMRYEKAGSWFEVRPQFQGVPMTFEPRPGQLKATYLIDSDITLVWNLTDPYKIAGRKIAAFTALDAANKPVELIETRTDTSLSVRVKSTAGVTWPVTVDPTVNDTVLTGGALSASYWRQNAAALGKTWEQTRDTRATTDEAKYSIDWGTYVDSTAGYKWVTRCFLTFPLKWVPEIAGADSARLHVSMSTSSGTPTFVVAKWAKVDTIRTDAGNETFDDLDGWVSSGSYEGKVHRYSNSPHLQKTGGAGWYSVALNDTALTDIKTAADGDDSLHLALLTYKDWVSESPAVGAVTGFYGSLHKTSPYMYLEIYYRTGNPPGLSTLADTALAVAILVGEIDSTGGINCTARGFQWWIDGDTTTISKSGSFTAGEFQDTTGALPLSVTVSFRSFATNTNGTTYGSVRTFTTGAGGGSSLIVDGRTVNTSVR